MRGHSYPTSSQLEREPPFGLERQPPYINPNGFANAAHIPIDPALEGPPIDPALMPQADSNREQSPTPIHYDPWQPVQPPLHQYYQTPHGEPFAPPPPMQQEPPTPEEVIPIPKSAKKKQKKAGECVSCHGNNQRNKVGEPEQMVSCIECRQSSHLSCTEAKGPPDMLRSFPWRCIECKICEVCQQKGDDALILFCDYCDRGWHTYCVGMNHPPEGKWHCRNCPAPESKDDEVHGERQHTNNDIIRGRSTSEIQEIPRQSPAASCSHSEISNTTVAPTRVKNSTKRKGKAKAEDFPDIEVDIERPSTARASRQQKLPTKRGQRSKNDLANLHEAEPPPPKRSRIRVQSPEETTITRIKLRIPAKQVVKEKEKEVEKDFLEDLLSLEERDTSKTRIFNSDKQLFERSRLAAEMKLAPPPPPTALSSSDMDGSVYLGPSSRPLRSAAIPSTPVASHLHSTLSASPAPSTPGPSKHVPPVSHGLRITKIRFGEFDIKTWYDAPFPEEYASIPDGRLWICEFCLKYMKSRFGAVRHKMKCKTRHPPGDEIYRDGPVSIFEVDGRKNRIYCQNLCLLSKMFLDHKSLFYDVEPFLFYVITETDDSGSHFVGYFSKEKWSVKNYNLSCIMTLPVRQRQGWGNLLMDFSYLLSKKEQRLGSPEKPLSGLGALGYKKYWTLALMRYLKTAPERIRLEDICTGTSMTMEDTYNTLVQQNMITVRELSPPTRPSPGQSIKFPKGRKNGVARRALHREKTKDRDNIAKGPFAPPQRYKISWDPEVVDTFLRNWEAKGYLKLRAEKLKWSPFVSTRVGQTAVLGPAKDDLVVNTKLGENADQRAPSQNTADESSTGASLFDDQVPTPVTPADTASKQPPDTREEESVYRNETPSRSSKRIRNKRRESKSSTPKRSTRASSSRRNSKFSVTDDEEGEEELVSPSEPQQNGRQSRSRTRSTQPAGRSPAVIHTERPRLSKRRRIDSSPETVDDPIVTVGLRASVEPPPADIVDEVAAGSEQILEECSGGAALESEVNVEDVATPSTVNATSGGKSARSDDTIYVVGNDAKVDDDEGGDEDADGEIDSDYCKES